ncbi:magnesium and cobalt efflux protein CorC [archaeon BMS3Abin16]|nr:magnesium and cobalt efflux protein CorC [archaeon BMS3Abin16]HDY73840.1 HlyC/CorC family transporter [Euryarchaeota archaeon]
MLEFKLIFLFFLLVLSGFFSGAETALISLSKIRLRKLVEEKNKHALILDEMLKNPNKMLSAILVGNNLVNVAIAAILTSLAIDSLGSAGLGVATGIATLLILTFGEILPKSFATKNAEKLSLWAARPVQISIVIFSPIVWIFSLFTEAVLKMTGSEGRDPFVSEEELRLLMDLGAEEGVIEEEEKEMIHGVFEFSDTMVREIMTQRTDMNRLDATTTFPQVLDFVIETGHSRIPVYEGNIDNIIGILYAKDLLKYMTDEKHFNIKRCIRPAFFVPETKNLDDLFREMRGRNVQIAIVLDEYGGTAGLVTLEDLLEEIVGEITDEYDVEESPVNIIDEDTIVVDGKMPIDEVSELLGITLEKDGQESIGGLVFSLFDRIPREKDSIESETLVFTVEEMLGKRIQRVRIKKMESASS